MKYQSVEAMPMLITVTDVADTLNIGRNKAYELVRSGKIKALKIGQRYRVPRKSFIAYVEAG